jgi:hypothetical protein
MFDFPNDRFRDELEPGERTIWSGQPQQGLLLRPADALMIPFSLLWGGFAFAWMFMAISAGAPFFFWIFGIPFVFAGIYIILGRFFVDAAQRRKTYYALTNERIIILSGLFAQNVKTLHLKNLPEINITTKRNGKGTITFGPSLPMTWMYGGGGFPNTRRYPLAPAFEMIDDARTVYQKIKHLQREGIE